MSRSRDGPRDFLKGYQGYLQADAFGGYDGIYTDGQVVEVGCNAHARRKFIEAQKTDLARATAALAFYRELYVIERAIKEEIAKTAPENNQPRPEAVVLGRPPEGADYVRLPPLGAWSWSGPSFLPGTGRGFSVDDDFQAYPLSCESLPKP